MRALVRTDPDGTVEVYPESQWTPWTAAHLDWEILINGWELVDPYQPTM